MSLCTYCNNSFKNEKSLYNHLLKAKYCKEKRGEESEQLQCKHCQKVFYNKRYLFIHEEKCNIQDRVQEFNKQNQTQKETIIKLTTLLSERDIYIKEVENMHNSTILRYENQIRDLTSRLENVAVKGATKPTNTNIIKLEYLTDELTSKDYFLSKH